MIARTSHANPKEATEKQRIYEHAGGIETDTPRYPEAGRDVASARNASFSLNTDFSTVVPPRFSAVHVV